MGLLDSFRRRRPSGTTQRRTSGPPDYENPAVVDRIQRDAAVDRETAEAWFRELLVFLDMVAASSAFISPPEKVDVAWHAFLLHTRDYEAYCLERFGRVIHHQPTGQPDPASYRRAYQQRSGAGAMDSAIWGMPAGFAAGSVIGADADQGGPAHGGEHETGAAIHDAGPGDGGGGGFFSGLFGGGDSGGGDGGSGGGDFGGSGGDAGGGSSCGGSSCGGGGGG
jgi:hypothetical protein